MIEKRNLYLTSNESGNDDPELKIYHTFYKKYIRNKKVFEEFERNIPEGCVPLCRLDICDKPQRSQAIGYQQQNELYTIEFNQKGSETIVQKRNFKNVNAYTGEHSRCIYKLCKECELYLDKDNPNTSFSVGW